MGGKVWDLPHNEDFRHSLIKLLCLLGRNGPAVLAGKLSDCKNYFQGPCSCL